MAAAPPFSGELTASLTAVRAVLGPEVPDPDLLRALAACHNNPEAAINHILDSPAPVPGVKAEPAGELEGGGGAKGGGFLVGGKVKEEVEAECEAERSSVAVSVARTSIAGVRVKAEPPCDFADVGGGKGGSFCVEEKVKKELGPLVKQESVVKEEVVEESMSMVLYSDGGHGSGGCDVVSEGYFKPTPISCVRPPAIRKDPSKERRIVVKENVEVEDEDFFEEEEWLLLGRTTVNGLSTCRGKGKLVDNEIVHFKFPPSEIGSKHYNRKWGGWDSQVALSQIVRFSTKRCGEIGKLPLEWAKCLAPLVNSSKVKVHGRCVAAPYELSLMQDILLYVSLYIHESVFTGGDQSSWEIIAPPTNIYCASLTLPTLFKLLNMKPAIKAEFSPSEFVSRKRSVNIDEESRESLLPPQKRGKGNSVNAGENDGEQSLSQSTINKLVGAVEAFDLQEKEPPRTLVCQLRPYQKQALYWMLEAEKGGTVQANATLHPCWAAYKILDKRASAIYVNIFSGEATTKFPSATRRPKGGILADAMGLGKTVMTIALILSRLGWEDPKDYSNSDDEGSLINSRRRRALHNRARSNAKGSTLIVCPMALLGQWQDELQAHSRSGSISVFVHYGGDKTNDPSIFAEHDVVLTTYGVLSASYKPNSERKGIFHQIKWYRVVLDEAHTIKSSKTSVAQAVYALESQCRWCLTGTPLQNKLEDLYSLLCFLRVQPWCNWSWWQKLIQWPYEKGDERGLSLVKAILKTLMLRRTKETKDKEGRPILVLPPADIQVVDCVQSEAEKDFYDALFQKSKVKFDQFVEADKVLNNYGSILELLLRLRQCCNHPFLVMSRVDTQNHASLNQLARRYLEVTPKTAFPTEHFSTAPSEAYVEEVVGGISRGETNECPICFESPEDPVLTPCAHRMCRECLLGSWGSSTDGSCPMCRKALKRADLITCPSAVPFKLDIFKDWKESSKVSRLISFLEVLERREEKSIVFSQWTSFLDLLQIALGRKGIGYLRYDGKTLQRQRVSVLEEFRESRHKLVLLMSLRAGGVGLNLTAASNVFLMDPWWNPAVEEQAIMRIHRMGQKRSVTVRRLIIKGSVEDRLRAVQARKQRMISGALTDQEVRTARIEELKMLFA